MVTIKISGKLDDVRETMETLRGVLKVVTISGTYQNRKEEGVRIYMQTFTSSDEKTRFMTKSKRTKFTPPPPENIPPTGKSCITSGELRRY